MLKNRKKGKKISFWKYPWKWLLDKLSGRGCKIGQIPKELSKNQ